MAGGTQWRRLRIAALGENRRFGERRLPGASPDSPNRPEADTGGVSGPACGVIQSQSLVAHAINVGIRKPMNWQDEHKKRLSQFPDAVQQAHTHSSNHRREIEGSESCGCFYCCSTFPPIEITDWVDEDAGGIGQCALCPKCGIDSVIGSLSGFPIDEAFLSEMKRYWF